jgi:hypothetical protein
MKVHGSYLYADMREIGAKSQESRISSRGFRTGNEYMLPVPSRHQSSPGAWTTGLDWWTGTIFYVHLCYCSFVVCMPARCELDNGALLHDDST